MEKKARSRLSLTTEVLRERGGGGHAVAHFNPVKQISEKKNVSFVITSSYTTGPRGGGPSINLAVRRRERVRDVVLRRRCY